MEDYAKNGSGYFDETAYKAIKRAEDGVLRGDIWEYRMTDGNLREVLVVSADDRKHSSIVSFILLCSELPAGATGAQITFGARVMCANCERVTYGYRNRLENIICNATDSEMRVVDDGMRKALQLKASTDPTEVDDECEKLKELLYKAEKRIGELISENRQYEYENSQLLEGNHLSQFNDKEVNLLIERNKLETERDLYKSLFETLQERMLGK